MDYTGVHPWWQLDDLLATGVTTKVPEKPNLFQETGLMRLEDLDGRPWRSPQLAEAVLEQTGYLERLAIDGSPEAQGRAENLMELLMLIEASRRASAIACSRRSASACPVPILCCSP